MSRHSFDTSIEIILHRKSVEIVATVLFNYSKGSNDYFDKSMGCWYPGDPAEIDPIKIIGAQIDGKEIELPPWLSDLILENLDEDALHEKAANDLAEEYDRAMEYAREDR